MTQNLRNILLATGLIASALPALAQHNHDHSDPNHTHNHAAPDSVITSATEHKLGETTVKTKRRGILRSFTTLGNEQTISLHELTRAACCNLGESFTTNPSVDVNYSDAATGSRQIRLLGLAGTYVQMMTENMPNFRIAAQPYGLSYVPGPWMQSIQVSKGAASVKNGYEAITGQINVEYKKPHQPYPNYFAANGYADMRGRLEGNVETTLKPSSKWGTTILAHYDKHLWAHDDNNDGFADMPKQEQFNLSNRWTYDGGKVFSQFGISGLAEKRESGQIVDHGGQKPANPYLINIDTKRVEAFGKTAYMFGDAHNSNLAIILNGSLHNQDARFGLRNYEADQRNGYASLIYETQFSPAHSFSAGASLQYDNIERTLPTTGLTIANGQNANKTTETVPGVYAQYTYQLGDKLTIMGGLRYDHSNLYGSFITPRANFKWTPNNTWALRASVGKGYRTTHVLEENNFYLAGSRQLQLTSPHLREEAWNYGASLTFRRPIFGRLLNVNAEYYYTDFVKQAVADFDSNPSLLRFYESTDKSYSSVFQIEATYPFFEGFSLTAAYRYTDVRTTYDLPTGAELLEKPLQGRYKGLFTATYATPLDKWQFDVTLQLNGGGRMPKPYTTANGTPSWNERYKAFEQLSAQITRNFRHWSFYIGGENLTGYKQPNAIIDAHNPWGDKFDPTMVYGPLDGAMVYVGFRYTLPR